MLAAALLLAAAPVAASHDAPQAHEAERAFASMAQIKGQWTAFRAFATDDAVMFAPELVRAETLLKDRKDPPVAVMWWPSRLIESCDNSIAISTGPWVRRGGQLTGTFTTVWYRQADLHWKWRFDHGRSTPRAVPALMPIPRALAPCTKYERVPLPPIPQGKIKLSTLVGKTTGHTIVQFDEAMPGYDDKVPEADLVVGKRLDGGSAPDNSLHWDLHALEGGEPGAHILLVRTYGASQWETALVDVVGVKAPQP